METEIKEKDGKLYVKFSGRLDTSAATNVENDIKQLNSTLERDIVLDCTDLVYISSSGLRIFLGILKSAKSKNLHAYIQNLNPEVEKIFKMTVFINLFESLE
jgi:anti-sigma B factor antagonist